MNTFFQTLLDKIQQMYINFQWIVFWQDLQVEVIKFATSEQLPLALLGVTAVRLSQSADVKYQRFASVFGLLGQPFWFYMAYNQKSWGVFILCLLYTNSWWKGFKRFWLTKQPNERTL